jgi:hypothetical protein
MVTPSESCWGSTNSKDRTQPTSALPGEQYVKAGAHWPDQLCQTRAMSSLLLDPIPSGLNLPGSKHQGKALVPRVLTGRGGATAAPGHSGCSPALTVWLHPFLDYGPTPSRKLVFCCQALFCPLLTRLQCPSWKVCASYLYSTPPPAPGLSQCPSAGPLRWGTFQ